MDNIFEPTIEFPDPISSERFNSLIGIDHIKDHVLKEAKIFLDASVLSEWSKKHYRKEINLVKQFKERAPLFLFIGDVGTGKTSLAETFGDQLARDENIPVTLYKLSLQSRGRGAVGEMTQLISAAFSKVADTAKKYKNKKNGKPSAGVVFLIDEADALAQSRELGQMHHEDKAGVNALIRGIDIIAREDLPVVVVMSTNRAGAIDPAVIRRAASIFEFMRPNDEQRKELVKTALDGTDISEEEIQEIVRLTGPTNERPYGFTYSDIRQRLLPTILLAAFPDTSVEYQIVSEILKQLTPTPPFNEERVV